MEKYLKSALSLVQAEKRAELFNKANQNNISYNLFLKLKKGDIFEGLVTVHFDLAKVSKDFFLEFAGTTISEIVVNGTNVPTTDQYESLRDKRFLNLPESYLKEGKNEVKIKYLSIYANDGLGLHSFVDTDGKQYIYSQCEAYAANKILPCFDQPDLKATLTLTMAYPKEWLAVANQPACEESTKKINKNTYLTAEEQQEYTITAYLTTPRLPTYLYAFIAGPYIEIKSENVYNKITMSCFCRESLVPHLKHQAEEIFDITRESIKFYESYFNYPYPFLKYDSIFCPEYKFGAMENPGAVTFNDRYLWREKVTQDRNTMRANTIAHEAAHHWFGDLVTMKWWNDLWLNESFADYISHYCLYNIRDKVTTTKFSDIWLTFFDEKGWGYDTDQQKTTHPIAGDVMNTDQAESIFDGITYSKGAATLKQLMSLIGEANFGKAMGSYFKTYEWSNATLSEFIGKLQDYYLPTIQGSPENLESWKAEWLQTAGLNECKAVFNPEDTSAQAKLVIKQGFALEEFATLRHHKMKVAFFDKNGKVCEEKDILLANIPETTITYDGSKQPQAVILNYQDQAFIKIRLDDHSAAFLKEHMNAIPDQLTRAMIWRSLFDMVRDGQFSAAKFVQAVVEAIPKESSDSALNNILGFVSESLDFSPDVLNDNVLKPKLFNIILEQLLGTEKSNTNRTVMLRENLIRFASFGEKRNVDNVARLIDWFEGKDSQLKDFHLEIKDRWSIVNIIHKYPRLTDAKKNAYFNQVADLDSSDRMKLAEQKCEAMRAGQSLRKKLFESYLDPENKLSVQMVEQSMLGYSTSLRAAHTDEVLFFDHLVNIFQTRNNEFAQAYYYGLFPHKENFTYYSQRIQELLGQATDNDWLQKCLKDSLDHIERKRKGYLCSAPDVMKEFFDISF